MDSTQIIITRLLKEVQEGQTIALGPGIPQLIKPHLEASIHVVDLTPDTESQSVQLAVVEAEEVSQQGDFCLAPGQALPNLEADQWIVAAPHTRADGAPRIVQTCQLPISDAGCASTIITDLSVIRIQELGLVLKEVAPGVGADEVKTHTTASIHVADDIKVMEL